MMKQSEPQPPKLVLKFFRWFCHDEYREEIEGDLLERHNSHFDLYGKKSADRFFIKEVLLLLRPSLIGNIKQLTNLNLILMNNKNRRLIGILATCIVLLLIPLIAMQFSNQVDWGFFDFLVMAILLLSTGFLCELVLRRVKTTRGRVILCCVVLSAFLLVWAELAVGIFGSPIAGN